MYPSFRIGRPAGAALALVLMGALVVWGVKRRDENILTVEASAENFRDAPNGKKVGTLLEGTELEKLGQEGKWVRFRVEGWIWGPSLEGFAEEREEEAAREEEPRLPLQDNLPRIKRFINDKHGVFYGINLDEDLRVLVVRLRVQDIGREALERKQMAIQREVFETLEGEVEFDRVRVETNRPDGSGRVGLEIAETEVGEVRLYAGGTVEEWKAHTRLSTDGGQTWKEVE
jgi:hypothetical protein